jgi:beta-lactamase regulating signal transducer with metallopeptidase domain
MTPSYLIRLVLLSSASFFLVQLVVGAILAWITPQAIRRAGSMGPRRAARFLLTLRLLPSALSVTVVAALCVPSYLRFEPLVAEEEVGFACLAAAILGAALCAFSILRAVAALLRSWEFVRACDGVESRIDGETVWVVKHNAGLALAGILRPRLLISEAALRELSPDQLAVAMRHECAHRSSLDNWKRLLILLTPSIFPRLRLLDRAWAKNAEWAADEQATDGSAEQSAALAEALVRVARLQAGISMPVLVTCLVEADEDLSQRVDRLLDAPALTETSFRTGPMALAGLALLICGIAVNPASQRVVHHLLEILLD